jgi:hypothetical protein
MKKTVLSLSLASTILFSSCIGSFGLFNKVLDWNKEVTDSKFANEVIFLVLYILPVYGIASAADLIIFNSIEFWTGDNPIGMKEGKQKIKIVEKNGKQLQITTTKNKVNILVLKGENVGNSIDLVYNPSEKSWNFINKEGKTIKLTDVKEGMQYVYLPNNKVISIDMNASTEEKIAKIEQSTGRHNLSNVFNFSK